MLARVRQDELVPKEREDFALLLAVNLVCEIIQQAAELRGAQFGTVENIWIT